MLGWQGSNLRMRESKSRALPLGYTPTQVDNAAIRAGGRRGGTRQTGRTQEAPEPAATHRAIHAPA